MISENTTCPLAHPRHRLLQNHRKTTPMTSTEILETTRSRMEREAIHGLQETLYNEILPFVVWKDVPECQERILAALVAFQEELEAIPIEDTRKHVSGLTK